VQGKSSFLDGGRELSELYNQNPLQAVLIERMIASINLLGQNSGVSPIGDHAPPPPVDNLSVKAAGEMVHFAITHSAKVRRNIRYFIEADNSPAFPRPVVTDLGSSRSSHPLNLPSLDDNGNQLSWYFRAYAQYPGSRPSVPTVVGGANNPTAIKLQGATKLTLLNPTGSGTASTTGMQGGAGLGKTPQSSNAVLRTGKLQGGLPVASALPGSSVSMDTIANGPVTYFKIKAVNSTTSQATTSSLSPNAVTTSISSSFSSVGISTTLTLIGQVTITTSGGIAIVSASGIVGGGPAGSTAILALYKGDSTGTLLYEQSILNAAVGGNGWSMANIQDTSPGASQLYSLYGQMSSGTGTVQDCYVSALNLKV